MRNYYDAWVGDIAANLRSAPVDRSWDRVRSHAAALVAPTYGTVAGVLWAHGLWSMREFHNAEVEAAAWLHSVMRDPTSFTYAAVFDKERQPWPGPLREAAGNPR